MRTPYKLYFRSDINKNKRICQVHDIIKYKEVLVKVIFVKRYSLYIHLLGVTQLQSFMISENEQY